MVLLEFIEKANFYGAKHIPFLFLVDFEMHKLFLCTLDRASKLNVLYQIGTKRNFDDKNTSICEKPILELYPINYEEYLKAFDIVMKNILAGNTYLLNLTFPTTITTNCSLLELFHIAKSPYKLFFDNQFILFSPESFIKTKNRFIFSYPMKGTIDASLPNAKKIILKNKKEEWEHNTIVDLIRNDLSIIAKNITVTRFRFITKIYTNRKDLLQVSSEIRGKLPANWQNKIGEILVNLLPAGSISGAPKKKTVEIIKEAEKIDRGYYTGIFGIYDGTNIDSAVNIRFIEKIGNHIRFRSGGGITSNSNPIDEYRELKDKVYVPII
ncbi:para-aminobenzoate synthase [Desulfurella acetivorans A63]|nr:para-aminobenzoate synthase [Desulfurella acetivorans A63]